MEKKYIKPEIDVTKVNPMAIIATSIEIDETTPADPEYSDGGEVKIFDIIDGVEGLDLLKDLGM